MAEPVETPGKAPPDRGWRVLRQDDHGNRYLVVAGITEGQAKELAAALTAGGHKQHYWAAAGGPTDPPGAQDPG